MKEFIVYTLLRLVLFGATLGIVLGAWVLITGSANILASCIIAFLVSGAGSYVVLSGPRSRFAVRVEARAERAVARYEEARSKEDADQPLETSTPPATQAPTAQKPVD